VSGHVLREREAHRTAARRFGGLAADWSARLADVENPLIEMLSPANRRLARMVRVHRVGILASLTIGALVVALGQVSHHAVQLGEIRRAAIAANTAAFWSCHNSHSRELRDSCLAHLNLPTFAPSDADAAPQGQHIVAVDLGEPISGR
jgi:hypothetical protein